MATATATTAIGDTPPPPPALLVGRIQRKKRLNRQWLVLAVVPVDGNGSSSSGQQQRSSIAVHVERRRIRRQQHQQLDDDDGDDGADADADAICAEGTMIDPLCLYINAVVQVTRSTTTTTIMLSPHPQQQSPNETTTTTDAENSPTTTTTTGTTTTVEQQTEEHLPSAQQPPPPPPSYHWIASTVTLLQCAPDPRAVPLCMDAIRQGRWPLQTLAPYGHDNSNSSNSNNKKKYGIGKEEDQIDESGTRKNWIEELEVLLQLKKEDENRPAPANSGKTNTSKNVPNNNPAQHDALVTRHQTARKIVRTLLFGRGAEPRPRPRLPHTKRAHVRLLENLERAVELRQPVLLRGSGSGGGGGSTAVVVGVVEPEANNSSNNNSSTAGATTGPNAKHGAGHSQKLNLPKVGDGITNAAIQTQNRSHAGKTASSRTATTSSPSPPVMMSSKGPRSRADYLLQRKHPQIAWMVERIRQLLARNDNQHHHIVDVGGGRGDLTVALAQALFSENGTTTSSTCPTTMQITLVDCNASSLRAAQEHAAATIPEQQQQQNPNNSLHFVQSDFAEYCRDDERYRTPPTVVVALHACGDLSDAALQFAVQHQCSFCICPCCYTKRNLPTFVPPFVLEHQAILDEAAAAAGKSESSSSRTTTPTTTDSASTSCTTQKTTPADARNPALAVLGRLAETDERPGLLRRAAIVFNSMRIRCIPADDFEVRLEEYDPLTSNRNLVLVGTPKQQKLLSLT